MASPQVCGIIACLVEQEPNLTQAEARQHLIENSLQKLVHKDYQSNHHMKDWVIVLIVMPLFLRKDQILVWQVQPNYIKIEILRSPLQLNILELGIKQPLKSWQLIKHQDNN